MPTLIKTFSDGAFVEYDRGGFDSWCVYITKADGSRMPPHDIDYFGFLQRQAGEFGAARIYEDFVSVYNATGKTVEEEALILIDRIAETYGMRALDFNKIYTILYMAMIAEENKAYTKLGKRIKRLGVYMLLIEGKSVSESANFMRGMGWRDIDKMCQQRGF